jgi:hypothetical protein
MPLMKRKSKGAFEHNIKAEMRAGKPQDQALAIAYSVKRKAKKMAKGGSVSASNERRPMPDSTYDDTAMTRRNSGNKAPAMGDDAKTQGDISYQSKTGMKTTRIKHPKMVASNVVQARLRDEEDDLMYSAGPNEGPQRQPPQYDNEEGPDRQGPTVPDMEDEHSTRRKPYAKGGEVEASDYDHPLGGVYEDDLQDLPPSEDEGAMNARSRNEVDPDRQGDEIPDTEEPHSERDEMFRDNEHDDSTEESDTMGRSASGGMDQPEEEEAMDHAASVAAAIMMKRKKMAEGGEILSGKDQDIHSHGSYDSDDSDQADLSRNADEDANEEDQMSFDALRKENYSESEGLRQMDSPEDSNEDEPEHEEEDVHDRSIVGQIRSKMKKRSPITR